MIKNIPFAAMVGLCFTALYFFVALFAPLIAPYGMAEIVGEVWEPASADHWLGTDNIKSIIPIFSGIAMGFSLVEGHLSHPVRVFIELTIADIHT